MAEFIEKTDTLNEGREKINVAIQDAEDAKTTAGQAVDVSEQAKQIAQTAENKADNVQEQFNQVVIEGDSSVEAAQARVDADNNVYATLKERLDTKETQFSTQLAQIVVDIEKKVEILSSDITYSVGENGDFTTINEALEFLTKKRPSFNNGERVTVDLILKSGFIMKEQVIVDGLNLSYITLKSEDDEVVISREHLTVGVGSVKRYPAFLFQHGATSFVFDTLFYMDESGEGDQRSGIFGRLNANVLINAGAGVKNAGSRGLHLANSFGYANGAIFTDCKQAGIRVANNGFLMAEDADVSGSTNGLLLDFAKVDFKNGIANNCETALRAVHSEVDFGGAEALDCNTVFSLDDNSKVYGSNGVYRRATGDCVNIRGCSILTIANADLSESNVCIRASTKSKVNANGSNLISSSDLSVVVNDSDVSIENTQHKRIALAQAGKINCHMADATPYTGDESVVMWSNGGNIVNANNVVGYTIPGTANTITSNGIIFSNVPELMSIEGDE